MVLWGGDIEGVKNEVEYTGWLFLIGMLGFFDGIFQLAIAIAMFPYLVEAVVADILLGIFLLLSSVLFLTVRKEMTYLMFTGMFAVFCIVRAPVMISTHPGRLYSLFIHLLSLGYLFYKYFDLRFRK